MKNNGGPAFPIPVAVAGTGDVYTASIDDYGMTLRDYFAAAALAGLLTDSGCAVAEKLAAQKGVTPTQSIAWAAFDIADAMLEARDK